MYSVGMSYIRGTSRESTFAIISRWASRRRAGLQVGWLAALQLLELRVRPPRPGAMTSGKSSAPAKMARLARFCRIGAIVRPLLYSAFWNGGSIYEETNHKTDSDRLHYLAATSGPKLDDLLSRPVLHSR